MIPHLRRFVKARKKICRNYQYEGYFGTTHKSRCTIRGKRLEVRGKMSGRQAREGGLGGDRKAPPEKAARQGGALTSYFLFLTSNRSGLKTKFRPPACQPARQGGYTSHRQAKRPKALSLFPSLCLYLYLFLSLCLTLCLSLYLLLFLFLSLSLCLSLYLYLLNLLSLACLRWLLLDRDGTVRLRRGQAPALRSFTSERKKNGGRPRPLKIFTPVRNTSPARLLRPWQAF